MPLYETIAADLVKKVHSILMPGKDLSGTCTNGGASTFVDTARTEADDYFQNTTPASRVRIYQTTDAAAPQGQERTISDWVNSTGTGTVSAAWTTANPASGDKYLIMSEYYWSEIFNAINDVISSMKNLAVIEKADTTITLTAGVYEYDIPAGFTHIYRVTMDDGTGAFREPINPASWRIIRGTNTPRLHFVRFPTDELPQGWFYSGYFADDDLAARQIRIEGFGYQQELLTDFDSCYLDPMFVCYQAAADLHGRRMVRADTDPTSHQTQLNFCQSRANEFKPKAITTFPPNTRRIYN